MYQLYILDKRKIEGITIQIATYSAFLKRMFISGVGALWWTRTTDPRFRKQMLYPAELRVHKIILIIFIVRI